MPALNAPPPAVAVASRSRRRVWAAPELRSHALLVLTPDRIHLAPLAGPPKPHTAAAAAGGADLGDLLGPLATVIDLAAVRGVKLDLPADALAVEYVGPGARPCRLAVVFATPEAADACFTKVWRRLGRGFELRPYRRDFRALARGPLVLLAAVLLATAALALTLSVAEDVTNHGGGAAPPESPLEALAASLDWRAVCVAGGAAAAAAQVWLYRRVTRPPVVLELARN